MCGTRRGHGARLARGRLEGEAPCAAGEAAAPGHRSGAFVPRYDVQCAAAGRYDGPCGRRHADRDLVRPVCRVPVCQRGSAHPGTLLRGWRHPGLWRELLQYGGCPAVHGLRRLPVPAQTPDRFVGRVHGSGARRVRRHQCGSARGGHRIWHSAAALYGCSRPGALLPVSALDLGAGDDDRPCLPTCARRRRTSSSRSA